MKKLQILAVGAAMAICASSAAFAQSYTHQRIGNFDYYTGDNAYSGTGQRIGNFYYYYDNYGSGVGQRIGNFDYYNYTPNYTPHYGYGY